MLCCICMSSFPYSIKENREKIHEIQDKQTIIEKTAYHH